VLAARSFSRAALGVIVLLAITGTTLAVTHVGNVAGLVGTSYGRLLLAKLGLLVLILGLAAVNRFVLLARLGGDGPAVGRPAMRAWRLPLAMVALALLGAGAGLALPSLAIDAYPTTYLRPSVPYQAGAITAGAALYQANCAGCHGPRGAGDGPDGRGLPRSPA